MIVIVPATGQTSVFEKKFLQRRKEHSIEEKSSINAHRIRRFQEEDSSSTLRTCAPRVPTGPIRFEFARLPSDSTKCRSCRSTLELRWREDVLRRSILRIWKQRSDRSISFERCLTSVETLLSTRKSFVRCLRSWCEFYSPLKIIEMDESRREDRCITGQIRFQMSNIFGKRTNVLTDPLNVLLDATF